MLLTFLDDGIGVGASFQEACDISILIQNQFQDLGFLFANEKCEWSPSQERTWLGLYWNTKEGKISVSEDRIKRFKNHLDVIQHDVMKGKVYFHAKTLAKIAGHIISMKAVFGDTVRFKSRGLYECISQKASWYSVVKISALALKELEFWRENVCALNKKGCGFESLDASCVCNFDLVCDASDVGFGGYIDMFSSNDDKMSVGHVYGSWASEESLHSSTWRELEAVNRVLKSNISCLKNDNQSYI